MTDRDARRRTMPEEPGVQPADTRWLTPGVGSVGAASFFSDAGHTAAATVASLGGGHLADRLSPRLVFTGGAAVYVASYLLFAWNQHSWPILLVGFLPAGIGSGFAESTESTVVALTLPDRLRGNGYGVLGLVQSLGDLAATLAVGVLWAAISPTVAFAYAAIWTAASVVASTAAGSDEPQV
ncbi:MFS transporter [Kribbella sp. NPDC003557]|uniref:MFS transporter n=1 Tax=Kribbella sp. NPDC003557 TaxID=3154449 RepID=UPI0033BB271E